MRLRNVLLIAGLAAGAALALPSPRAEAATKGAKPGSQIQFGVDMARRGLWREALFRFEQAGKSRPRDAEILNNIAVAYEALGLFEQALEAYKEALEVSPNNRELRQNYSRFLEFYQSFKPAEPEEASAIDATEASAGETPETEDGSDG